MSEMTPWMRVLISVFVVSVKRQVGSPSAARSDRRVSDAARRAAVTVVIFLTVFGDFVAVASVISATSPAASDLDIFGSRLTNRSASPMASVRARNRGVTCCSISSAAA